MNSYLKLLLHIFHHSLAVKTDKSGTNQFRVNRMGSNHLTRYLEKGANAGCFQVTNLVLGTDINKADVQFFFNIEISFVLHKAVNSLAQVWIHSE